MRPWLPLFVALALACAPEPTQPRGSAPAIGSGWLVAPSGRPSCDGSAACPWDLATALAAPPSVRPGDTVWIAAGTYSGAWTSKLAGTADQPVVIRGMGRATIEGRIVLEGPHSWLWGVEVTQRAGAWRNAETVVLDAPGTRLVNSVVHHAGHVGVAAFGKSTEAQIYGSLIYGNFGHGIYAQNPAATPKRITDNLVFNAGGAHYGIHLYTENGALRNFHVVGNFVWHNGVSQPEMLYGGARNVEGGVLRDNVFWHRGRSGQNVRVGYGDTDWVFEPARSMTVERNVIVGGRPAFSSSNLQASAIRDNLMVAGDFAEIGLLVGSGSRVGAVWERNRLHGYGRPNEVLWPTEATITSGRRYLSPAQWLQEHGPSAGNTFSTTPPTATQVIVRPNAYEPGRAHVAVLNWRGATTVPVDLSGVLRPGQRYEIRHAQRFYGPPVLAGVYDGQPVSLSMAPVLPEPTVHWEPMYRAVANANAGTPPATGPDFNVFVVLPVADR